MFTFSPPFLPLSFLTCEWTLKPIYRGGKFGFSFNMPVSYPHEPPKVKCTTKVYHPNIDLEGNVCLNILREDWKPVLSISSIVYGLQFLFLVSFPSAFSLYFSRTRELKGVDFANLTLACSIFFTGPKPRGPTKQGSGSDLERRPKAVPVKC